MTRVWVTAQGPFPVQLPSLFSHGFHPVLLLPCLSRQKSPQKYSKLVFHSKHLLYIEQTHFGIDEPAVYLFASSEISNSRQKQGKSKERKSLTAVCICTCIQASCGLRSSTDWTNLSSSARLMTLEWRNIRNRGMRIDNIDSPRHVCPAQALCPSCIYYWMYMYMTQTYECIRMSIRHMEEANLFPK